MISKHADKNKEDCESIIEEDIKKFVRLQESESKKKLKQLEKEREDQERKKLEKAACDPKAKYSYHAFSSTKRVPELAEEISELNLNIIKSKSMQIKI
jgi:hypothetical protein